MQTSGNNTQLMKSNDTTGYEIYCQIYYAITNPLDRDDMEVSLDISGKTNAFVDIFQWSYEAIEHTIQHD